MSKCELFDQITFPVGRINEDIGTNYKLFMQAKKIAYTHKNLYFYRIRKTSISNSGFVCLGEQHSKFTNFHVALRFIII